MKDAFRAWLTEGHYRPSTISVSVRQLGRLIEARDTQEPLPEYCTHTARRTLQWLQNTQGDESLRRYLVEQGITATTQTLREKPKTRVWEARSFDEDDWATFGQAIVASDDARDRVVEVMCVTGIRVGDALRIESANVARALRNNHAEMPLVRKGGTTVPLALGVLEPWQRLNRQLQEAKAPTVAALLSPKHPSDEPGDAPYQQIHRRLKWWQKELSLKGRVHTHKMRRTFAVRLYKLTKDPIIVAQGLNNGAAATAKYLDESRTDQVADYQRQLRGELK